MVKKTILDKIKKVRALLKEEEEPVEKLILYGSHARGRAHKDSDIDLCVILKGEIPNRYKKRDELRRLCMKVDVLIEPVVFSLKDYKKNRVSPLLHEIRKEGIEI